MMRFNISDRVEVKNSPSEIWHVSGTKTDGKITCTRLSDGLVKDFASSDLTIHVEAPKSYPHGTLSVVAEARKKRRWN